MFSSDSYTSEFMAIKTPKVTKKQLLDAFQRLCTEMNVTCRGFDPDAINGRDQWALIHKRGCGWMVVCGLGGCGVALGRWNNYLPTRWSMLMALEMTRDVAVKFNKDVE